MLYILEKKEMSPVGLKFLDLRKVIIKRVVVQLNDEVLATLR